MSGWQDSDSKTFLDFGRVFTPDRDEIERTILDLIPARRHERFHCVDLGAGQAWLSRAILRRFDAARVLALDGSPAMIASAREHLSDFGERAQVRQFDLERSFWIDDVPSAVRCFASSLAFHHLRDSEKRTLFARLYRRLEHGGALLIADIIAPGSDAERRFLAERWDEEVRRQSMALLGSSAGYDRFDADRWNWYRYPDPTDMPGRLSDQLRWLEEAGFTGASAFWLKAGHCVFGGFKSGS